MFRANVNEMNVQPVDLGDELWQGIQLCLALAPVVFRGPIVRECLSRRELHALRSVCYRFPFWPPGCIDAPPQFSEIRFRKIHFLKRTNRSVVSCMVTPSLCSICVAHSVVLT